MLVPRAVRAMHDLHRQTAGRLTIVVDDREKQPVLFPRLWTPLPGLSWSVNVKVGRLPAGDYAPDFAWSVVGIETKRSEKECAEDRLAANLRRLASYYRQPALLITWRRHWAGHAAVANVTRLASYYGIALIWSEVSSWASMQERRRVGSLILGYIMGVLCHCPYSPLLAARTAAN